MKPGDLVRIWVENIDVYSDPFGRATRRDGWVTLPREWGQLGVLFHGESAIVIGEPQFGFTFENEVPVLTRFGQGWVPVADLAVVEEK